MTLRYAHLRPDRLRDAVASLEDFSTISAQLDIFFFYCSGDPRDLHSFPTRRSSDLATWPCPVAACASTWCRAASSCCRPTKRDRKSTRLNSSHLGISYAVFCLKK